MKGGSWITENALTPFTLRLKILSLSLSDLSLSKTPKKGQKVQKPVSGFLSVSAVQSSADKASPATFNVDTVVEVYRFGHTKCYYKRHTIVCSSLLDKSLNDFKKSSRQSYGLEEDARRANIGSFDNLTTFTGKTEAEWQNVIGRLSSQLHQYQLLSK